MATPAKTHKVKERFLALEPVEVESKVLRSGKSMG